MSVKVDAKTVLTKAAAGRQWDRDEARNNGDDVRADAAEKERADLLATRTAVIELVAAVKAEREARIAVAEKNRLLRSGEAHPDDYHPGADAPDGISLEQRLTESSRRVTSALTRIGAAA